MKYRERINKFMEELTKDFTVKPVDPISNYRMTEAVRKWMYAETTPVAKLLREDNNDDLTLLKHEMKDTPSSSDLEDLLSADEDELEKVEEIRQLIIDSRAGDIKPWTAWDRIEDIVTEMGQGLDSWDVHDATASFVITPGPGDVTLIYDDVAHIIGWTTMDDWESLARRAYKPGADQDEETYIDWFDPRDYDDSEEATEAVIDIATKKKKVDLGYGPLFPDERTYFPLEEKKADVIEVDKDIAEAVDQKGYEIEDYTKGLAKQKKGNRQIKIGKLLKGKPQLIKKFNERLKGQKKDVRNLSIVFSHNPRDIATMSTGRGWTSCADLEQGGPAAEQLPNKIKFGGMVAYLINNNDKNINDPIARVSIRRFLNEKDGSFVLLPENRVYGSEVEGFDEQVVDILGKNNDQTMKTPLAIVRDAENGYSDTFSGKETIIKGTRLADLLKTPRAQGAERKIKSFILKKWDEKVNENVTDEMLDTLYSRFANNLKPKSVLEILLHIDKKGTLSKKFPKEMFKFIHNFRTDHEEYPEAIDKYIEHLSKTIPESMKDILELDFGDRSELLPSHIVNDHLTNAFKKHLNHEYEISPEEAKSLIRKKLGSIKKNPDSLRRDDVTQKINFEVLNLVKHMDDHRGRTQHDSMTGRMLGIEPLKGSVVYNKDMLRNLTRILRTVAKKTGPLTPDETFSLFRQLESDEMRKEFMDKNTFLKHKLFQQPTGDQLKEHYKSTMDFIYQILRHVGDDDITKEFSHFGKYLHKSFPERSKNILDEMEETYASKGPESKKAFSVFKDYLDSEDEHLTIDDHKMNEKRGTGTVDHKKRKISFGDEVKVLVGNLQGKKGKVVGVSPDGKISIKGSGDEHSLRVNPHQVVNLEDDEEVDEEIQTEEFYEDANKAFRLLDLL